MSRRRHHDPRSLTQRYGLVHVDFETLVRTPKKSFDWYAAGIAAQASVAEPDTPATG